MEVLRVHIKGWTASFRYPNFISGYQPTLPVPPLSTVFGILQSVKGEYVTLEDTEVGYFFKSSGRCVDLEHIYEVDDKFFGKSNVCRREILFEPEIYLYIKDLEFEEYFKEPRHTILLGRSQDLAYIKDIKKVDLIEVKEPVLFGGTTVPFPTKGAFGFILALPSYFTNEIPREGVDVKPFYIVDEFRRCKIEGIYYDDELNIGVYMHGKY
ncbi:MAG: type I-B CRISPR-associated protein Cas5b [Caloramator sp.]|nr:type I-B CRISPR-associated protein Cas5b [Caloramator sp.]